jgi:hypothetical protein
LGEGCETEVAEIKKVLDYLGVVRYYTYMNTNTPVSESQKRAMALLNVTLTETPCYARAAAALEAKGLGVDGSGIPAGHTWRTAKKLTDAELLSALHVEHVRYQRSGIGETK